MMAQQLVCSQQDVLMERVGSGECLETEKKQESDSKVEEATLMLMLSLITAQNLRCIAVSSVTVMALNMGPLFSPRQTTRFNAGIWSCFSPVRLQHLLGVQLFSLKLPHYHLEQATTRDGTET
jgi:hypothetical protein